MATEAPEKATCRYCGYSLRGLTTTRCPECGEAFDPDDPTTYDTPDRAWWFDLAGPPRRWHRRTIVAATVVMLIAYSDPALMSFSAARHTLGTLFRILHSCSIFVGLVIAFCYLVLRIAAGVARAKGEYRHAGNERGWRTTPLCLLIIISVFLYPWPMWVRFQISRPWLEKIADHQLTEGLGTSDQKIGGLYVISGVYIYNDDSVHLPTYDANQGWRIGFLRMPDDRNPPHGRIIARLGGRWFAFRWPPPPIP